MNSRLTRHHDLIGTFMINLVYNIKVYKFTHVSSQEMKARPMDKSSRLISDFVYSAMFSSAEYLVPYLFLSLTEHTNDVIFKAADNRLQLGKRGQNNRSLIGS